MFNQDWKYIYLDHKVCAFQNEGKPWAKVTISMPAGKYEGYHVDHACGPNGGSAGKETNYVWIRFPEYREFQLIKTDREPGTRHKRIKLTAAEFEGVFKEMDDRLHRRSNLWLAEIMDYDFDRRGIEWSRLKHYAIGSLDGSWFYIDEDDKRRISAKTFRLIKPMNDIEVEEFNQHTSRISALRVKIRELNNFLEDFDKAWRHSFRAGMQPLDKAKGSLLKACQKQLTQAEDEINSMTVAFEEGLKSFGIEVPEDVQEQLEKANTKKARVIKFDDIEPLPIMKESERAVQISAPTELEDNRCVWLPKVWVKLSEDSKSVVAVNEKAKNKIDAD